MASRRCCRAATGRGSPSPSSCRVLLLRTHRSLLVVAGWMPINLVGPRARAIRRTSRSPGPLATKVVGLCIYRPTPKRTRSLASGGCRPGSPPQPADVSSRSCWRRFAGGLVVLLGLQEGPTGPWLAVDVAVGAACCCALWWRARAPVPIAVALVAAAAVGGDGRCREHVRDVRRRAPAHPAHRPARRTGQRGSRAGLRGGLSRQQLVAGDGHRERRPQRGRRRLGRVGAGAGRLVQSLEDRALRAEAEQKVARRPGPRRRARPHRPRDARRGGPSSLARGPARRRPRGASGPAARRGPRRRPADPAIGAGCARRAPPGRRGAARGHAVRRAGPDPGRHRGARRGHHGRRPAGPPRGRCRCGRRPAPVAGPHDVPRRAGVADQRRQARTRRGHQRLRRRRSGQGLEIRVANAAATRAPTAQVDGAGAGLLGLGERVALSGGTLEHGPRTTVGTPSMWRSPGRQAAADDAAGAAGRR